MIVEEFKDGLAICGDSTSDEVVSFVLEKIGPTHLIIADPPYGCIVDEEWDKTSMTDDEFSEWMITWTHLWSTKCLHDNAAFYVWGGIGKPKFRPFFRYVVDVELKTDLVMSNMITWKKRRAIGTKNNYLFTREELAYLTKGKINKPLIFNVPLLDEKRGYEGFNKKYPAKSEYYRRSNVWTDVNELFQGKVHPTQKPVKLHEIIIKTHTNPGDWVIDPFAGSGVTALACRNTERKFCVIERKKDHFDHIVATLR